MKPINNHMVGHAYAYIEPHTFSDPRFCSSSDIADRYIKEVARRLRHLSGGDDRKLFDMIDQVRNEARKP